MPQGWEYFVIQLLFLAGVLCFSAWCCYAIAVSSGAYTPTWILSRKNAQICSKRYKPTARLKLSGNVRLLGLQLTMRTFEATQG